MRGGAGRMSGDPKQPLPFVQPEFQVCWNRAGQCGWSLGVAGPACRSLVRLVQGGAGGKRKMGSAAGRLALLVDEIPSRRDAQGKVVKARDERETTNQKPAKKAHSQVRSPRQRVRHPGQSLLRGHGKEPGFVAF